MATFRMKKENNVWKVNDKAEVGRRERVYWYIKWDPMRPDPRKEVIWSFPGEAGEALGKGSRSAQFPIWISEQVLVDAPPGDHPYHVLIEGNSAEGSEDALVASPPKLRIRSGLTFSVDIFSPAYGQEFTQQEGQITLELNGEIRKLEDDSLVDLDKYQWLLGETIIFEGNQTLLPIQVQIPATIEQDNHIITLRYNGDANMEYRAEVEIVVVGDS